MNVDILKYEKAFAWLGNAMLVSPNLFGDTLPIADIWKVFPSINKEIDLMVSDILQFIEEQEDFITSASLEYAQLFIGPPEPKAFPWQSNYEENIDYGFGKSAIDMREIIRGLGLSTTNEFKQYDDHIGMELIVASELIKSMETKKRSSQEIKEYLLTYPIHWIDDLAGKVHEHYPDGYYYKVLKIVKEILFNLTSVL